MIFVLEVGVLTVITNASVFIAEKLEVGKLMDVCGPGGVCRRAIQCGASATIIPSFGQVNNPSDSMVYATSLDEYGSDGLPQWWAQAGFIVGNAPNGAYYSQPEFYFEAQGVVNNLTATFPNQYDFQTITPGYAPGFASPSLFQVFIIPGSSSVEFDLNGARVYVVNMVQGFTAGGTPENVFEVHQYGPQVDPGIGSWELNGYFSNSAGCGYTGGSTGWSPVNSDLPFQSCTQFQGGVGTTCNSYPYYLISGTHCYCSTGNFDVYTSTATDIQSLTANPSSVSLQQGYGASTAITVSSNSGGYISLSAHISATQCGFTAIFLNPLSHSSGGCPNSLAPDMDGGSSTVIQVPMGGSATIYLAVEVCLNTRPGTYDISVAKPGTSTRIDIPVQVVSGPGCGGGSVGAGTLIALADHTETPVQNLHIGMLLLSYDLTSHQYMTSTITRFFSVTTHNQMVISTRNGKPLIVDQNPIQKVYVKTPDGAISLISVTELRVGFELFDALTQTWVPVTTISYQNSGSHLMYDIYTSEPGNYIADGYLDPMK